MDGSQPAVVAADTHVGNVEVEDRLRTAGELIWVARLRQVGDDV